MLNGLRHVNIIKFIHNYEVVTLDMRMEGGRGPGKEDFRSCHVPTCCSCFPPIASVNTTRGRQLTGPWDDSAVD